MFEKLSQIAEQAATTASRRQFLGRLGQSAITAAAVVSGLLAFAPEARAGRGSARCCLYRCYWNGRGDRGTSHYVCSADGSACVATFVLRRSGRYVQVCRLMEERRIRNCSRCGVS